MRFRRI